jgi:uncharacterized protein (DUF58 family)
MPTTLASIVSQATRAMGLVATLALAHVDGVGEALAARWAEAPIARRHGRLDPLRDELIRAQRGEFAPDARTGVRRVARAPAVCSPRWHRPSRRDANA